MSIKLVIDRLNSPDKPFFLTKPGKVSGAWNIFHLFPFFVSKEICAGSWHGTHF
jgi:hypothetical protein